MIPCVIYGVKSSPDEKGAVLDQLRTAKEAALAAGGREIVVTFDEENQSGYRKSRGPELAAAIRAAVELAADHAEVELWCWHSSRLARGTGRKNEARALGALLYELREKGVAVRSATDDGYVTTEEFWGMASRQSSKYAEDLGTWTRAGIERRRNLGKPVGALPGIGYMVERRIVSGTVVSERVVNPKTVPLVVAMFERIAEGQTPGAVGRWLNEQGARTVRGALFNQRTVRKVIANDAFTGANGYPRIVSDELAARARPEVVRLDPAEIQRRKGGRRPKEPYMLRGIAFCGGCGAAMYRSYAYGGGARTYACRNRLEATGACRRPPIPAELLEAHVLNHLGSFVGSVDGWITEILDQRKAEAAERQSALDLKRAALAGLDRQREERLGQITDQGITSPIAFEVIERIDRQREAAKAEIREAEAIVAEWRGSPDMDAVLDFYNGLVDVIQGRIGQAPGIEPLNEALATVLAGLWCELEPDGDRLLVRFALRSPPPVELIAGVPLHPLLQQQPRYLPPARLGRQRIAPLDQSKTSPLTTVSAWRPYRLRA